VSAGSNPAHLSVIVPAYNEAAELGSCLQQIRAAIRHLEEQTGARAELIVVNNASTDATASIAREHGATVIAEPERNISRARNTGAAAASGEVLVFLDADTRVPDKLLARIAQVMADPLCAGGACDIDHRVRRTIVRAYLQLWRILGKLADMAQGAAQFCRREAFDALGGYDQTLFMGEDVDFYWRLRKMARKRGQRGCFLGDARVVPSPRRFDQWPLWRILLWTNPAVVLMFRRRKSFWSGWYQSPPR